VRVIGSFVKENNFHLEIDDNQPEDHEDMLKQRLTKATMIIVEPHILIPTT
jgi:uncharacterized protein YlaN (UPF0358 family)